MLILGLKGFNTIKEIKKFSVNSALFSAVGYCLDSSIHNEN